jgi:hypothetical protein
VVSWLTSFHANGIQRITTAMISFLGPLAYWKWTTIGHSIGFLSVVSLWYYVCRRTRFSICRSFIVSLAIPLVVLLLAWVINDGIFKNALSYPRPAEYSNAAEDAATRLMHAYLGVGQGAPSGYAVRQTILLVMWIWIASHAQSPFARGSNPYPFLAKTQYSGVTFFCYILSIILQVLLLAFVCLQRIAVYAHGPFDLIVGIGIGILIFWTLLLPAVAYYQSNAALFLLHLATLWLLLTLLFVFQTQQPASWIKIGITFFVILTLISHFFRQRALKRGILQDTRENLPNEQMI